MTSRAIDLISLDQAPTLPALFLERVRRTPHACAYRHFDLNDRCCTDISWQETLELAGRWQAALRNEGLPPGERVAVMLRNGLEWVAFDLAALGLGLVTVPLFVNDRPDNFAYIIEATNARLLLIEGVEHWQRITTVHQRLGCLARIVSVNPACEGDCDLRLVDLDHWLPATAPDYSTVDLKPDRLASIVYTSGTTGNPKGVMLTHAKILANAFAGISAVPVLADDLFLSFLPLSHTLERTVGYYLPIMAGACVAHVRSLDKLAEDLPQVQPTVIVSVPRVFERVYQRIRTRLTAGPRWKRLLFQLAVTIGWRRFQMVQGRENWSPAFLLWPVLDRLVARPVRQALGGRVRLAISGGAPLNPEIARVFIALGINILQGYGLTETSPVVSVNTDVDNRPDTVGRPLPGVEVRLAEQSELLVRGPSLMAGYWQDSTATAAAIDTDGWFHTGD
jgi:long-chain acyl-CoA synthetase